METQQKLELQAMPFSTDKKWLFEKYLRSGISEREIRAGINAIIAENRGINNGKAVCAKSIRNVELLEFVEQFGLPKGYKSE